MPFSDESVGDATQVDDSSSDALIGRVLIDRYVIEEVIGQGGMSVVYLARDLRLDRPVAVKVFSGLALKEEARKHSYEHFVQEAFALSELKHPNTLRIFDFAYLGDKPPHVPFQVSEHMDGGTLRDLVKRRGTLSLQNTLGILHAIGGALSEAHACGIVHRDVKPTNILFAKVGRQRIVKLADFSVAFALKGEPLGAKQSRPLFYSRGWSPPEQMKPGKVTPAADVYGLGLLLAYMLSGEAPRPYAAETDFAGDAAALDRQLLSALDRLHLPQRFFEICMRACAARPEERHESVDTFLAAVRAARVDKPTPTDQSPWNDVSNLPTRPSATSRDAWVVLHSLDRGDLLGGGRHIRVVGHGCDLAIGDGGARVRVSLLAAATSSARAHVRGLSCFVRRDAGRPTTGLDLSTCEQIELVASDRAVLGTLKFTFGDKTSGGSMFQLKGLQLIIPSAVCTDAFFVELADGQLYLFHSL